MVTGQVPGPWADDQYDQVLALLGFDAEELLAAFGWRRATGYLDTVFVTLDQARHHGEFRLSLPSAIAAGRSEWAAFWDRLNEPEQGSKAESALDLLRLADRAMFGDPRDWLPLVHSALVRYLDVPPDTPDTYLLTALVLLRGSLEPRK
jgi:hypothetical protein